MTSSREQSFMALVSANRRRLRAIARSYARGDAQQDLYQEILLQLWRSIDRFEGRSSIDTWIYRVALNTAIVWRRKRKAEPVDGQGTLPEPSQPAGPRVELAILEEFVHSLDAADRAVFVLYLEDLSYKQIAEVTGLSEGNVGVKLHRLKNAFKEKYL